VKAENTAKKEENKLHQVLWVLFSDPAREATWGYRGRPDRAGPPAWSLQPGQQHYGQSTRYLTPGTLRTTYMEITSAAQWEAKVTVWWRQVGSIAERCPWAYLADV